MINETVAHYRILRKLGAGGMGVVYEAEDTKLGRRVALKFLPEDSRQDKQALERFLREARAASALSHSSICTIHAIEDSNDGTFISMELLEGESLDKLLASGPLPISRAIEMGIHLADALDAAHKKGIVHRDIKPANIFITDTGGIKILDFGLAKLLPRVSSDSSNGNTIDTPAVTMLTSPGMAVGTIQYMSPEQARGEEIDARSDLFSLGAVLYQMLTGRQAFPGSTSAVVFDNILNVAPVSPVELNAEVPAELERIINKALEKDRDVRYQVAAELRADLKRLQRQFDSGSRPSASRSATQISTLSRTTAAGSAKEPAAAGKVTPSSGSVIVAAAKQHKLGTALTIFGVLALIAAAGYGVYSILLRTRHVPFENFTIENLTNNGHTAHAAISPDGKYLLNVHNENGLESLWLRHIPTSSNTQILPPTATHYFGLTFSPDGNYIFCVRRDEQEHTLSSLYSAPVLGGTPRLVLKDVDSPITFAPDGQRFAYLRQDHDSPSFDLLLAHSDGTPDHALFREKILPGGANNYTPAWSPDGKTIVIAVPQADQGFNTALLAIDVISGRQHLEASPPVRVYHSPAWMPDGNSLVVSDFSSVAALNIQLGILSYPDGQYRRLTTDTNAYLYPSVAADGRTIVASQVQQKYDIQIASLAQPDDVHNVPLSSRSTFWSWDWTNDGRIVLPQFPDIRVVKPEGGEAVIYSDANHFADQVVSCGSSYLVYRAPSHAAKTTLNLWRMSPSGADSKQLTFGSADADPQCAADGQWVYYIDETDNQALKRVPINGGSSETILSPANGISALSPDGKTVAGFEVRELDHKLTLKLYTIDDKKFAYHDLDQSATWPLAFAPDGKSVIYSVRQKGIVNLWMQPLDNSPSRQLTHFTSEGIEAIRFSKDGTKIAMERGHDESDAVLLRDASH
jgi:eukaryotic-like serine/threonine-protein kinase